MPSFESHIKSHNVKILANKKARMRKAAIAEEHTHYKGTV